jgi:Na+-transporting NADH:ubiquinone oxidoreductase subunit A
MGLHKIKRGLDLPMAGGPAPTFSDNPKISRVAIMADDYIGMKPTMFVKEGDTVKRGQTLFEDKKTPGVVFTAPGAGTVSAVNRGDRRALQSVVIELSDSERDTGDAGAGEATEFSSFTGKEPAGLSRDEIKDLLVESGLWTTIRTRPFSKVPSPDSTPHSIFVTAMDTNPHAPDVNKVIEGQGNDFQRGLICVAKLTEGSTFVCRKPGAQVPVNPNTGIRVEEFEGPHPAGTVGLHIHTLAPVYRERTAWYLNYQEVIAIGRLFDTGRLDVGRIITIAGPQVQEPRHVRTRVGASTAELTKGGLKEGENRVISGSVLSGRTAIGDAWGYLGRHHHQVTALREGRDREFIGWLAPGKEKFSTVNVYISALNKNKAYDFTTNTNGSERAMVPIGMYERILPWDLLPTFLLRALIVGDIESAEQLGCLELDEEDLALCTYVCPGKYEYGPLLRKNLTDIEKEG